MSYSYQIQRPFVFTEKGQEMLLAMRDIARQHIEQSGAVCYAAITRVHSGSRWDILACVDRLIELGDLRRLDNIWGGTQDDVFISSKWKYKAR